jgi:hypothetical protein
VEDFEYDTGQPRLDGMAVAWKCAYDAYDKCVSALQLVRNVEAWSERDTHHIDYAIGVLREWHEIFQDLYDLEISRAKQEADDV